MPKKSIFLSTLSLRRATPPVGIAIFAPNISIHALLAESDWFARIATDGFTAFLSTLSLRRATRVSSRTVQNGAFLSTLSLRRATCFVVFCLGAKAISIHALLAESDQFNRNNAVKVSDISIHALLAESDTVPSMACRMSRQFLSTLSLRRATADALNMLAKVKDFYPRSPCGERRVFADEYRSGDTISIHALLAESDRTGRKTPSLHGPFLSTLSLRRATAPVDLLRRVKPYFYPRSPCGERLGPPFVTLSNGRISIHALLAESDENGFAGVLFLIDISIHALLAESDGRAFLARPFLLQFLSTLSLRRATLKSCYNG